MPDAGVLGEGRAALVLELVPITQREAAAFVDQHHRHHRPSRGAKFCLAIAEDGEIVGVAMVGRPVSRLADDGWTLEVTRVCTLGTRNACSLLYRAAWRAAKAMGYRRVITYTLASESGASLRGAGFRVVGEVKGQAWSRPSRPRVDLHPAQDKIRWEAAV